MSRAMYSDSCEGWRYIMWRGQVASAIRGKRGQAFLRELVEALDALPEKRLIADALAHGGEVCAIGSVGARRGLPLDAMDSEDHAGLAKSFGVAAPLVREIEFENDEGTWRVETPEQRWKRMREWAVSNLRQPRAAPSERP